MEPFQPSRPRPSLELFFLNLSPAYTHLQLHNSVQDWGGREDSSVEGIFELLFNLGRTQPFPHLTPITEISTINPGISYSVNVNIPRGNSL